MLLAHQVEFNNRPPQENDSVEIGIVKTEENNHFEVLGRSFAWNWQQGSMLQWHPANPEQVFLYNDRRNGTFVSVVCSIEEGELHTYSFPIYAIHPEGKRAFSLNFSRLQEHRPGYGYAGVPDLWEGISAPQDDGIYGVDLETGESNLLISLEYLASLDRTEAMKDTYHWVNHIQVAPSGDYFAFMHRWRLPDDLFATRLYIAKSDGSELSLLIEGMASRSAIGVSHYDWMDGDQLLVWAKSTSAKERFVLCNRKNDVRKVLGEGVLTEDGHCSYSPNRKWILNDTYPDRHGVRTLMLFHVEREERINVARFYTSSEIRGEIRCDLHPRWDRKGLQACVDSVHTNERQMYVVDLRSIIGAR